MNVKELAVVLTGLSYKKMVPLEVLEEAKESGLVIVWGTESDTMEFTGAFFDSAPCHGGCVLFLDEDGVIKNKCIEEDCPYFLEKTKHAPLWLRGNWCTTPDYTWICDASVSCERFDILQDGEKYCRGIVFDSPFL